MMKFMKCCATGRRSCKPSSTEFATLVPIDKAISVPLMAL